MFYASSKMTSAMTLRALILCVFISCVTSACPDFPGTNGISVANVTWVFDYYKYKCNWTVEGLLSPCVNLTCDMGTKSLRLVEPVHCDPSCGIAGDVQVTGDCSQHYTCTGAVYKEIPEVYFTNWYAQKHGWFAVYSGYTCGTTGSGPCESTKCLNPFVDPKSSESECVEVGDTVHNSLNQVFQCQELTDCQSNTYVDLVLTQSKCEYYGQYVDEGTIVDSDACNQSVCVVIDDVGYIVSSFKDQPGCVFGGQCVPVGEAASTVIDGYVCANLTCRYDPSSVASPYSLQDRVDTGCFYEDACYGAGAKVSADDQCKFFWCKSNAKGKYSWTHKYTGCYDPFTNECLYQNEYSDVIDDCVKRICDVIAYGKWRAFYTGSSSCVPDADECEISGVPGCKHNGQCYPVKGVLPWDDCSQYVCHSSDAGLNSGIWAEGTPRPVWKARPLGCYGPKGCMALGTQWVDPVSLNTYRCDYDTEDWETKNAQFHQACVAPDGTALKVGDSLKIGSIWYSCYRWGKMSNPIDTSIIFVPAEGKDHTCGRNPDTGNWLYITEYFYTPVGRCQRTGWNCDLRCAYFDQPCTHLDLEPNQWRWLGEKFALNGSECFCTQDYNVNNKIIPPTGSLFDTPSLCSQPGVTNAACNDTVDGSLHQWGELWNRPGSKTLIICGCHPLLQQEVCSDFLPDVISATSNQKI